MTEPLNRHKNVLIVKSQVDVPGVKGENYDAAETDTIYQRSTAICKNAQKLEYVPITTIGTNSIANLSKKKRGEVMLKYLILLLSDDAVSYCHYETKKNVAKQ